jgi:DNA-binding NarL/FixJ family response regulator
VRTKARLLLIDDFAPWRRYICSAIEKHQTFQIVAEGTDGLEAIEKAQELQPDLILLDIGLPKMNGIEAARRIQRSLPQIKILFVSAVRDPHIVEAAFRVGASGYMLKSNTRSELLPALEAVLQGGEFVSAGCDLTNGEKPLPALQV